MNANTFEIDATDLEDGNEEISEVENEYVGDDEEIGEIPAEVARKVLGRSKADKEKDEVVVSGPKGKTVLGKHIRAKLQLNGLYSLYFKEGGELPELLKGSFTDIRAIEEAVDHYLQTANKVVAAA